MGIQLIGNTVDNSKKLNARGNFMTLELTQSKVNEKLNKTNPKVVSRKIASIIKCKNINNIISYNFTETFDVNELVQESYKNFEYVGETIERRANEIAKDITNEKEIIKYITYMMREIMRNVVEHSKADKFTLCCQKYSYNSLIGISVTDKGIGIKDSLNSNPHYRFENDSHALIMAVQPGITKAYKRNKRNDNNVWQNSGFGLFMVSSVCQKNGFFSIRSGSSKIEISKNNVKIKNDNFKGTNVKLLFNPFEAAELAVTLRELSIFGSKIAKSYNINSIKTASHVSTMLINTP